MLKKLKTYSRITASLLWLAMASSFVYPRAVVASTEQTFDVFQVGTKVYTNVTVTTKTRTYVFILYQGGMANIPLAEISPELRSELGYGPPPKPKEPVKDASAWAKKELATFQTPEVKEMQAKLDETWKSRFGEGVSKMSTQTLVGLLSVLLLASLIYLFGCHCCALICRKAGYEPSGLVWVPILQCYSLLRAAEMSAAWMLLLFVPILNFLPYVIWCSKIAKARSKGILTFICLVVPVINLLAFLYLAFSDSSPKTQDRASTTLTLEAA
jgi:hypothetical protein